MYPLPHAKTFIEKNGLRKQSSRSLTISDCPWTVGVVRDTNTRPTTYSATGPYRFCGWDVSCTLSQFDCQVEFPLWFSCVIRMLHNTALLDHLCRGI